MNQHDPLVPLRRSILLQSAAFLFSAGTLFGIVVDKVAIYLNGR